MLLLFLHSLKYTNPTPKMKIKGDKDCPGVPSFPLKYKDIGIDAHLLIFVVEGAGGFMGGLPCELSPFDNRPIMGVLSISDAVSDPPQGYAYKSALHEFFHIMFFNKLLFGEFVTLKSGQTFTKNLKILKKASEIYQNFDLKYSLRQSYVITSKNVVIMLIENILNATI